MQCASPHTRATRPFLSAREQAVRSVAHQPRQVIARSAETYISPSSRTALSELQALQRYSEVRVGGVAGRVSSTTRPGQGMMREL